MRSLQRVLVTGLLVVAAAACSDDSGPPADSDPAPAPSESSSSAAPDDSGGSSDDADKPLPGTSTVIGPPPAGSTSRCAPPTANRVSKARLAFDGVVTSMSSRQVVLETTRWYTGDPVETVTVQATPADLQEVLATVDFTKGERYLVSTGGGLSLMYCGLSDRWSPSLAKMYAAAFGG